jgi:hypothetical protein
VFFGLDRNKAPVVADNGVNDVDVARDDLEVKSRQGS